MSQKKQSSEIYGLSRWFSGVQQSDGWECRPHMMMYVHMLPYTQRRGSHMLVRWVIVGVDKVQVRGVERKRCNNRKCVCLCTRNSLHTCKTTTSPTKLSNAQAARNDNCGTECTTHATTHSNMTDALTNCVRYGALVNVWLHRFARVYVEKYFATALQCY